MNASIEDKTLATMLAAATGDAFAAPFEHVLVPDRQEDIDDLVLRNDFPRFIDKQGRTTDDTQLARLIGKHMTREGVDIEGFSHDLRRLYETTSFVGEGSSISSAAENLSSGLDWSQSGVPSDGCGSVMRSYPLGLVYSGDRLAIEAIRTSRVTHISNISDVGCVLYAQAIHDLLYEKTSPDTLVGSMSVHAKSLAKSHEGAKPYIEKFEELGDLNERNSLKLALERIGSGAKSPETLVSGVACLVANPDDYISMIVDAARYARDADSVASVAGALAGAYHGPDILPMPLLTTLQDSIGIVHDAQRLYGLRS